MSVILKKIDTCFICKRPLANDEDLICIDCIAEHAPCLYEDCNVDEPCCCIFAHSRYVDCKACEQCHTHSCDVEADSFISPDEN